MNFNSISIWFNDNPKLRAFSFSTLWLLLLMFFTYTPLASALIHSNMSFLAEYTKMQCQMIAMVVNFGLVFMIVVDAWGANQEQEVWQQVCNYLSFFLVIGIYWHSRESNLDQLDKLEWILSWKELALIMHIILLALLLLTKTCSVYQSSTIDVDKAQQEF